MIPTPQVLLRELIDYAGLFPPAALGMGEAVQNFAAYQRRADRWALARLVLPVARLGEFESALSALAVPAADAVRWPLAVLAGTDPAADRAVITGFNRRHRGGGPRVESIEVRTATVQQVLHACTALGPELERYCELPLSAELPALVAATKQAGARAKIRAGGVNPADVPAAEAVLAFLAACAAERLAFKATAGLHHPLRGPAPLTYEAGGPWATMHGYLNLILAATVLWHRGPESEALRLLELQDRSTLTIGPAAIEWDGLRLGAGEIEATRRHFALAIGSCSFTEPLDEFALLVGPVQTAGRTSVTPGSA